MPGYPIEPDKLLDAAERLAPASPGRGRPPYTAHRRAVSTAYYAIFHAITERVAETVFPDAFLELNDRREQADYDHDAVFTRPDTRGQIALARRVVALVEQADSDAVKRFYGLIALQARIQAR